MLLFCECCRLIATNGIQLCAGRDCVGKICQAARTNGRVKSLELQTIPDLHIGGVITSFYEYFKNNSIC